MAVERLRQLVVLALTLALASCSSSSDDLGPTSTTVADQLANTTVARTTTTAARQSLVCEDPPPVEVALGSSTDTSTDADVCFYVGYVPPEVDSLTFRMTGLTADLDMLVGYGFLITLQYPGLGEYWTSKEPDAADETITIDDPGPGPFFLKVGPGKGPASSQFTLTVSTTPESDAPLTTVAIPDPDVCAAPATEMLIGDSLDSEVAGRAGVPAARRYFCVQVPDGVTSITVDLTGLSGDLDLFVRHANLAEIWTDRSRGSDTRTVTIDEPTPGAYFIDVASAYPNASSTFTVSVSGS